MAKRRGFFARRTRRAASRRSYSRSSGGMAPEKVILPALAYGATRSWLAGMAAPLTSKIPLGNYADELVFGAAGWYAAKKGKGIVKQIGLAVLTVEAASVGNQLAGGMMSQGSSTQTGYIYG